MTVAGTTLTGDDLTVDYIIGDEQPKGGNNKSTKNAKGKKGQQQQQQQKQQQQQPEVPAKIDGPMYEAQADPRGLLILLDVRPDAELEQERVARELINRIQRARKKVRFAALRLSLGFPVVFLIDNFLHYRVTSFPRTPSRWSSRPSRRSSRRFSYHTLS